MRFDDTDKLILLELTKDSRVRYNKLADKLGIAYNTLVSRIKKMEENEVIQGYSVCVNFSKLGFDKALLSTYSIDWEKHNEKQSNKLSNDNPSVLLHGHSPLGNHQGLMLSLHPPDFDSSKVFENTFIADVTHNHQVTEFNYSKMYKAFNQEAITALLASIDPKQVKK